MIIAYESKTGFTKRYADLLSQKTGMKAYGLGEMDNLPKETDVLFLGWMKAGKIQGLNKARHYNLKAVCGSGTARRAEPDENTVIARNQLGQIPFFYLRGGCLPLHTIKGLDRILLSILVRILEAKKDKDESLLESIANIKNGFNGVQEENLAPLLNWLKGVSEENTRAKAKAMENALKKP